MNSQAYLGADIGGQRSLIDVPSFGSDGVNMADSHEVGGLVAATGDAELHTFRIHRGVAFSGDAQYIIVVNLK